MRIKRVEIIGFKSFCDRAVVHIDAEITGVVGPNGCGKSNIVDAIRWAMGEQSAKHLRGKAMEDVIFNGSETRGPAPMAEVSLTFDDVGFSHETLEIAKSSDERAAEQQLDALVPDSEVVPEPAEQDGEGDVPAVEAAPSSEIQREVDEVLADKPPAMEFASYTEVTITRRLYRDGLSQYYINKTPCRLRDITDFFLGTGVGTKAYAIIEQGRIGQIVSARPQDRRAIIEEAAGITKFKAKKKAAEKKLDQTRQNLMRVSDIVIELDKRMGTLRRQAQKAERYRKYKGELRDIELWKASHRWLELHAEGALVGARLGEVRTGVEDTRAQWMTKDAHVVAERAELSVEERRLVGIQEHVYELDNRLRLAESKIEFEGREADELDTRIDSARTEIAEVETQRERGAAELAARDAELAQLAGEVDRELGEVASRETAAADARTQLAAAQTALDEARGELSTRRTEIATSDAQLEALARRRDEASRRLERVMAETEQHVDRSKELDREGRRVDHALVSLRQTRLDLGNQTDGFGSRRELLADVVARGEVEVETLRTELHRRRSRLTSLVEIQERYEGFQRGTRAVMQQADELGDSGQRIRGVVADVVRAPEQLEVAVEALLGDRLGGVLVEDPEVGVAAIGFLKQSGGGRSAFVPLSVPAKLSARAAEPVGDVIAPAHEVSASDFVANEPERDFEAVPEPVAPNPSSRFEGEGGMASWMSPAWSDGTPIASTVSSGWSEPVVPPSELVSRESSESPSRESSESPSGESPSGESMSSESLSNEPVAGAMMSGESMSSESLSNEPVAGAMMSGESMSSESMSSESMSSESMSSESMSGEPVSSAMMSGESMSSESMSSESMSSESMSSESMSGESMSSESMSSESSEPVSSAMMSGESMSNESMSNESMSNESMSNESMSNESMSNESMSGESMSNESMSNESMSGESMSGESMSSESMSGESMSGESMSGESMSGESMSSESMSSESMSSESMSSESMSSESMSSESSEPVSSAMMSGESMSNESMSGESISGDSVSGEPMSSARMSSESMSGSAVVAVYTTGSTSPVVADQVVSEHVAAAPASTEPVSASEHVYDPEPISVPYAPSHKIDFEDRSQLLAATNAITERAGVLGRMSDLVGFAEGYAEVGKRLLADAVVVEDLSCALALHGEGITDRLVTLDGDVVEGDGVVAGGSRDAQGAGVLAQKREMRDLEDIVGKLEHDLGEAMQRLVTAKTELAQIVKALEGLRTQVHQGDVAIMGHEKDDARVRSELERHRDRLGQLGNEQLELEHRLRAIEIDDATARERRRIAEDRIAQLEREQLELISRLSTHRERLDELVAALTEARVRAAQLAAQRSAAEASSLRLRATDTELAARGERLAHEIDDAARRAAELRADCAALATELEVVRTERGERTAELDAGRSAYEQRLSALTDVEIAARELRGEADRLQTELGQLELRNGQIAMTRQVVEDGVSERYQLAVTAVLYDYHQRPHITEVEDGRLTELKDLIERMGTDINLTAIEEFDEVSKRFEFLSTQKGDLERAVDQLQRAIDKINKTSRKLFRDTFAAVNQTFKEVFPRLFRGGQAALSLSTTVAKADGSTSEVDLLEAGIEIMAQPPGKKNATVDQLSGGEKALTAVALVFSIFLIKPSPFCILDEVDAPLDEANVDRYNELVREMTDRSQFIVITHNKRTMESADNLYGVTMQEPGVSKLVNVNLAKIGSKPASPTGTHSVVAI